MVFGAISGALIWAVADVNWWFVVEPVSLIRVTLASYVGYTEGMIASRERFRGSGVGPIWAPNPHPFQSREWYLHDMTNRQREKDADALRRRFD